MKICPALLALFCCLASAAPASSSSDSPGWTLVRTDHFELYSQSGEASARAALTWFEQLRAFAEQQAGLNISARPPVRVIAFRSLADSRPYQLRPTSKAYYIGTEGRDYIVMSGIDSSEFPIAAHEYEHLIRYVAGLRLPPWLDEGLADFFSTVRIQENDCTLGGDLPSRSQLLRRVPWMPLRQLLTLPSDSPLRDDRDQSALFYAESWALTQMLILSPEYGPRFQSLIEALASGTPSPEALPAVFRKPLDAIEGDMHASVRISFPPLVLPGIPARNLAVQVSILSPFASRSLMADLLLAGGQLDRAESLYRNLAGEAPADPDISAALGTIALRKGHRETARKEWKRAIDLGITDAGLCYRYVAIAQDAGVPPNELRTALERAIALKPDFDDARFNLALLESNAGRYDSAVTQLRAMRHINPARSYAYWSALAYALTQLDKREEAISAARQAMQHAANAAERANAAQLAYVAQTDLAVQFTRDASGRPQLMTTRVPHNTQHWNAFIEPGDKIRRASAKLREIQCRGDRVAGVTLDTAGGPLTLAVPDPSHVLMTNAPAEFTCGPQPLKDVNVEYAAAPNPDAGTDGILRGMEFR